MIDSYGVAFLCDYCTLFLWNLHPAAYSHKVCVSRVNEQVDLTGAGVGDDVAMELAQALHPNSVLTTLCLAGNAFTDAGVKVKYCYTHLTRKYVNTQKCMSPPQTIRTCQFTSARIVIVMLLTLFSHVTSTINDERSHHIQSCYIFEPFPHQALSFCAHTNPSAKNLHV